MNNIQKLYQIAQKQERLIIGLMSGTSLDGLDIALCKFSGKGLQTQVNLIHYETVPYQADFKEDIKKIFSKQNVDLELLCLLNEKIGLVHAELINTTLKKWNIQNELIDAIASHGQTIFHSPFTRHRNPNYPNSTLQIGDGDHIAVKTGIITVSDFRQKNIAAGAEGAPLAVYGDFLLFGKNNKNTVLLNIGGISNITYLPKNSEMYSTDLGPGNTLIDQYMQREFGLYFDKDAAYAKRGSINNALLSFLLDDTFFSTAVPKSTGPELFNLEYLDNCIAKTNTKISSYDVLATLCEFTAITISKALEDKEPDFDLIVSGGGIHNPLIMERLKYHLPLANFKDIEEFGISADAKEAVLFALLANETLSGESADFKTKTVPNICMGKICLPN
ncbi:protein of unknown function UPF0075 [Pseudopedobacter saltans DSM 12145]|uniref:Anhydro-N-acetylmuramic acid kinase n=1 Tax=Pseudopedobacter saltans (strain ATCC 51119 / DSM 12145 / JCM 21818 / CCUG 39354 / LMG 10337 / NBRC 100064 / NCIMB 13643) TaxID=762903 RepID=F0S8X0_PSESL|nr:anhydro-N-acetylmuramic acid kinase [Pseudopedobacter saltans]ADY53457.1 protein of unknown function UPF0075 [Pseudopedobacter saltans DSM 12145]